MKVSIVTANYNCSKYLDVCINSVAKQKQKCHEHIILDDFSKDNSYSKIKKAARKHGHIVAHRSEKRLKCGSAYHQATKMATGDIIGILDADDALNLHAIENIKKLYEANPEVMYIWTQFWFCTDKMKKTKRGISRHPGAGRSLLEAGIVGKHCFSHWRTFRRELLDQPEPIFQEGLSSAVDKYMGYKLEELGVGGFIDIPMYYYRQRIGGLSYTGRRNWKDMKIKFTNRRAKLGIQPYLIKTLKYKGMK